MHFRHFTLFHLRKTKNVAQTPNIIGIVHRGGAIPENIFVSVSQDSEVKI